MKTKVLISFAVTATLFSPIPNAGFLTRRLKYKFNLCCPVCLDPVDEPGKKDGHHNHRHHHTHSGRKSRMGRLNFYYLFHK